MGNNLQNTIVALILSLGVAHTGSAQAHCDKGLLERVKFALTNQQSGFLKIRGTQIGSGRQYNLTSAGEQFCPTTFILEKYDAASQEPEQWILKFSWHHTGTELEVMDWVISQVTPALKSFGYRDPPSVGELEGYYQHYAEWDGSSGNWVQVTTLTPDDDDKNDSDISIGIRVGHNSK